MKRSYVSFVIFIIHSFILSISFGQDKKLFIDKVILKEYIRSFNALDDELYSQCIPNSQAEQFLENNIPLFECPDKQLEATYYFRWWTYRKHIKRTSEGYVITEFLPQVGWSGKFNTINCAVGHHFYEGRWLHNSDILAEYAQFWFTGGGNPRAYSCWLADAIYNYHLIHPHTELIQKLYPYLKENYITWEAEKRDSTGLFWQTDDRDGMELSVSGKLAPEGKGYRATINSYMYSETNALSKMATELGYIEEATLFNKRAEELRKLINEKLWNKESSFYEVIPKNGTNKFSGVRELHGFTPWYFNIPPNSYSIAWKQLMNPFGFFAPYGPTTVEQRCPDFAITYDGHECQWNGPSWPYSTSVTLVGLANLLNNYSQKVISKSDYMTILKQYSISQQLIKNNGVIISWIDENLNPFTGDWISRTILKNREANIKSGVVGTKERGKDYNHSTFCDLIISGLVGIRPQENDILIVNPLLPDHWWDYFCLDNVSYRNHILTILYDKNGKKYNCGKGFMIFVDGNLKVKTNQLQKIELKL